MSPIRHNEESGTVEVQAWAFNAMVGLASSLLLAFIIGSFSFYAAYSRLDEQVQYLRAFAEKGDRWTRTDGETNRTAIGEINAWILTHEQWGRKIVGGWEVLLDNHEKRLDWLEHGTVSNDRD